MGFCTPAVGRRREKRAHRGLSLVYNAGGLWSTRVIDSAVLTTRLTIAQTVYIVSRDPILPRQRV